MKKEIHKKITKWTIAISLTLMFTILSLGLIAQPKELIGKVSAYEEGCSVSESQNIIDKKLVNPENTMYIVTKNTGLFVDTYNDKKICNIYSPTRTEIRKFIANNKYKEIKKENSTILISTGTEEKSGKKYNEELNKYKTQINTLKQDTVITAGLIAISSPIVS